MDFLEKQDLIVYIPADEMIKTTSKLDHIMEMKLLSQSNYEKIRRALGVKEHE